MLDEAKKVYEGLENNGCNPNAASFRTVVFYLCLNGLYEQGYRVFKESARLNKIPDFNTLKPLAEGLVKKKKIKVAKGLMRTVKKNFPPNFLNAWTKLEKELGLVSCSDANAEVQEAKESTAKNDQMNYAISYMLISDATCRGEKVISNEDCFILKLGTSAAIREAQSGPNYEIINHTIWGYFSRRSGLMIQFEDSRLLMMKNKDDNDVFWEITRTESVMDDHKTTDGINIAHSGKTSGNRREMEDRRC
ncbi:proline-rich receptor-like protein kinase PERK4-like [Hibiscus syriacus]|uniref:Proline-rich receptor-like protein kinase PERK4-like n=1 Tax=Hibiscus syriacus TaxID=106335 RepID=A0A6A2Z0V4_HIBSY|nr:proline-rich receptor-like protein kinase PERK4-like [Hibiscus syriacus]